jgi:hypothetical protein
MFRFNRRFYRAVSFRSLLDLNIIGPGMTYDEVYERLDATIPLRLLLRLGHSSSLKQKMK